MRYFIKRILCSFSSYISSIWKFFIGREKGGRVGNRKMKKMGFGWKVIICNVVCLFSGILNFSSSKKCWIFVFFLLFFLRVKSVC